MIASKVGSVARAPGRACSTRRIASASSGGFRFPLSGTAHSLARLGEDAGAVPSVATSAERYDSSKRIWVVPVIVPELELVDVERHVGATHLVIGADHAALEHRPKAFDRICVNDNAHILALGVANDGMGVLVFHVAVARPFVGHDQFNLVADRLTDKALENLCAYR